MAALHVSRCCDTLWSARSFCQQLILRRTSLGYVCFSLFLLTVISHANASLSPFIARYQRLNYDTDQLHQRVRRAASSTTGYEFLPAEDNALAKPVVLKISTLGRDLRLKLYPDESTFTSDHALIVGKNVQHYKQLPFLYEGYVIDYKNSYVHGSIRDGIFEGKIYLPDESFIVEPVRRYSNKSKTFHSIVYSERDVIHPDQLRVNDLHSHVNVVKPSPTVKSNSIHSSTCGLSPDVEKWMQGVQNAAVVEHDTDTMPHNVACNVSAAHTNNFSLADSAVLCGTAKPEISAKFSENQGSINVNAHKSFDMPFSSIYSLSSRRFVEENYDRFMSLENGINTYADTLTHHNVTKLTRTKRSVSVAQSQVDRKRVCRMYIQTDSFLWRHIIETERTTARARDEILSMIASHVKAISAIYQTYDFGGVRGIKFAVQRTTINDTDYCVENRVEDPFCKRHVDVSNLLSYNSLANHSDFCLAYLFTYRDFVGGTLGLAWVASPNGPSGGICEKYKLFSETRDGVRIRGWKSLNTGVITFVNYGSRVPPTVSHLTLAHEVGHNFGAPHDPAACQPNGPLGNFIMYPSATSGDKPNNRKFSECSLEKMTAVVQAVVNEFNGKRNCFAATDEAFCGNKITEEGEVCDCGYNSQECKEKCCYPAVMQDSDYKEQGQACTLRRKSSGMTVNCSPSQGPCCTENCTFFGGPIQCKQETECAQPAFCTGSSPHCPRSIPKQNLSLCARSTRVCLNGECSGSLCLLLGLEECFLTHERLPAGVIGQEMMCFVACQQPGKPQTCRSTYNDELEFPKNLLPVAVMEADDVDNTTSGIRLKPGSPCNNYRGYCDIFHRCRRVDSEGPLERITKFVLDERTLRGITQWARDNWWEAALVLVAAIIFTACFIKCCAVHTPSNNPKKKRHRTLHDDWETLSTTIRRGRGQRTHHRRRQGESSSRGAAALPSTSSGEPSPPAAGDDGDDRRTRRQRSRQRRSRDRNAAGGTRNQTAATTVAPNVANNNDNNERSGRQRDTAHANNASSSNNNNRVRGRRDDARDRRGASGGGNGGGRNAEQQRRSSSTAVVGGTNNNNNTNENRQSSRPAVNVVVNNTAQLIHLNVPQQQQQQQQRASNSTTTNGGANQSALINGANSQHAASTTAAVRQNSNSERAPLFMPNSVSSATTVQQIIPDSPPPTYHEAMQSSAPHAHATTTITTTTTPAAAATVTSTSIVFATAPPSDFGTASSNNNTGAVLTNNSDATTVPFLFPFVMPSTAPSNNSMQSSTNVVDLLMMPSIHHHHHHQAASTQSPPVVFSSRAATSLDPCVAAAIQQRPLPPLPAADMPSAVGSSATTTVVNISRNISAPVLTTAASSSSTRGGPLFNLISSALHSSSTSASTRDAVVGGVQLPPAGHRKNRPVRAEKVDAASSRPLPGSSRPQEKRRSSRDSKSKTGDGDGQKPGKRK